MNSQAVRRRLGREQRDHDGRSRVKDTPVGQGCTTRSYAYNANSDRLKLITRAPGTGGACDLSSTGTSISYSYAAGGDRLSAAGDTYGAWGDQTAISAGEAGGTAVNATYYANSRTRSITQGTNTITLGLDPLQRIRMCTPSSGSPETLHHSDETDSPSWLDGQDGSGWTRYIAGIGGDLAAVQDSASGTKLQLTDIHGDVVATASLDPAATALTQKFESDEFGNPRGGTTALRYQWLGGKQREAELPSGIIQMGQRLYVPQLGRFTGVDPVDGGSANYYDYVDQDPGNAFDLDGKRREHGGCQGYGPLRASRCSEENDTEHHINRGGHVPRPVRRFVHAAKRSLACAVVGVAVAAVPESAGTSAAVGIAAAATCEGVRGAAGR